MEAVENLTEVQSFTDKHGFTWTVIYYKRADCVGQKEG